jgi:hypothetical protein
VRYESALQLLRSPIEVIPLPYTSAGESIGVPHLSISQPHCLHVQPPHNACCLEVGKRKRGCGFWQEGQKTRWRFIPHLPCRRVSRTIKRKPITPSATSAKSTRPMPMKIAGSIFSNSKALYDGLCPPSLNVICHLLTANIVGHEYALNGNYIATVFVPGYSSLKSTGFPDAESFEIQTWNFPGSTSQWPAAS